MQMGIIRIYNDSIPHRFAFYNRYRQTIAGMEESLMILFRTFRFRVVKLFTSVQKWCIIQSFTKTMSVGRFGSYDET
jgi:hypothetical protein